MNRVLIPVLLAVPLFGASTGKLDKAAYEKSVAPFLQQYCVACHNAKAKTGGLDLSSYTSPEQLLEQRNEFERLIVRVKGGEMPPKGMKAPTPEAIDKFSNWFNSEWARLDKNQKPDPGRVTARRLNRNEYNNTIHDLLGIDFRPADDFPVDDLGYGFDNIGDVLSLSPVLMEKYLASAEKIAKLAIVADPPPKPARTRQGRNGGDRQKPLEVKFKVPHEGDYFARASMQGQRNPAFVTVSVDGKDVQKEPVITTEDQPRSIEVKVHLTPGEHTFRAELFDDPSRTTPEPSVKAAQKAQAQPPLPHIYLDAFEFRGPYNPAPWPLTPSHKQLFVCSEKTPECAKTILSTFMRRAWRRPVAPEEVEKEYKFVAMALADKQTFEAAMRVGVEAVLVSPNFLFRIERDPNPSTLKKAALANPIHQINDFELASRLSYFLWSSTPDDQLLDLAQQNKLHDQATLTAQLKRMLADSKSSRFVENFAGQWLQLRNLDSIKPDPEKFPMFDKELRQALKTETTLFFSTVLKEDRPVTDFLDGKYTFLNERLAKYYGIPNVTGKEFRKVDLDGTQRSGVITQGSVLTVSSYPTRTSPVIRGKWILENFLNAPPPPPPPNVPPLNESEVGTAGSMRQQLEKHRESPICASCHNKMDPIGFGLENYDAIGRWREKDGAFPIDPSGNLPSGQKFNGAAEMKAALVETKEAFVGCITEKMMTYALGRGLERYDRPVTSKIIKDLSQHEYRFDRLIWDIVMSQPFQQRKGVAGDGNVDTKITASAHLP